MPTCNNEGNFSSNIAGEEGEMSGLPDLSMVSHEKNVLDFGMPLTLRIINTLMKILKNINTTIVSCNLYKPMEILKGMASHWFK